MADQRAGRLFDVGLAHQALADQERPDANLRQPREIVRRRDPAFADDDPVARNLGGEPLAGFQRGVKGFQVAVVDADQARLQLERAFKLVGIVDFEQHVHAEREGCVFKRLRRCIVDAGHDDQDAVGAPGSRLGDLIGLVHEVLT